ncbi:MAG: LacI family DNA-binding transcriptional regulator [Sulfitobacter sp.]
MKTPYRRPKPRQAKLQMRDVARMAGVSAQTVSRYFKNPALIGQANRDRIAQVVADTGYFPNPAASSLSANRTNLIGIIVPTIDHSIFSEMVAGLAEVLERHNHSLLIAYNAFSLEKEEQLVERFLAYKVAGIVLIGQLHSERTAQLLRASATPTVELLEIDGPPVDLAIGLSNFSAAQEMTRHLVDCGRRKIGFISAVLSGNDRVQRRLEGYKAALQSAGLALDRGLVAHAEFKIENGAHAFAQMHALHPDLDAVISNDILGLGVQLQCGRMDLSVPEQIAITGFDNLEVSSILEKRLTTVKIDGHKMGALAGTKLLEARDNTLNESKVVDIGYEILWRETTP